MQSFAVVLPTLPVTAMNVVRVLAWLDDQHLLYSDKQSTWMVAANGSGQPVRWLAAADSSTVQEGKLAAP